MFLGYIILFEDGFICYYYLVFGIIDKFFFYIEFYLFLFLFYISNVELVNKV